MTIHAFHQVDVFATSAFSGNPLAVVHDADRLTDAQMTAFARWTNLSETTFLRAATDPEADYAVRIFTPSGELPFAGHPTLGSCHAWLGHGGRPRNPEMIVQQCGVGNVDVRPSGTELSFAAPALLRDGPVEPELLSEVLRALGLAPADVVAARWADNGPGWIGVLLTDAEAVLAVSPSQSDFMLGVAGPHADHQTWEVRNFFPQDGAVVEDPACGSFNASLAGWLTSSGRATAPYTALQGTALGRAARIEITQTADGRIWTGGTVGTRIAGTVEL